jgi:hypothetical protein
MPRGKFSPVGTEGLEFEVRRTQRLGTVKTLKNGRTPLQIVAIAEQAATVAEDATQRARGRQPPRPPLACREGCAWCCYKTVGTCAAEVIGIAEYLRQHLFPNDFRALQERVLQLDDQRQSLKQDRWAANRLPCSLLVGDRCSAYVARPLTCRGYNSSDAYACEQSLKSRQRVDVPVYAPQLNVATFTLDGLRAGLTESGLNGDRLELTAALRILFTVPDAVERWLTGEAVFAAARLP